MYNSDKNLYKLVCVFFQKSTELICCDYLKCLYRQYLAASLISVCVLVLLQSAYCGDAEEYDQSQFILSSAALNSVLGLPGEHSVLSHLKNDGSSYTLQNEELG